MGCGEWREPLASARCDWVSFPWLAVLIVHDQDRLTHPILAQGLERNGLAHMLAAEEDEPGGVPQQTSRLTHK